MSFHKPVQQNLKGVSRKVCITLEAYQAVIHNKKGEVDTTRRREKLIVDEFNVGNC